MQSYFSNGHDNNFCNEDNYCYTNYKMLGRFFLRPKHLSVTIIFKSFYAIWKREKFINMLGGTGSGLTPCLKKNLQMCCLEKRTKFEEQLKKQGLNLEFDQKLVSSTFINYHKYLTTARFIIPCCYLVFILVLKTLGKYKI